MDKIDEYLQYAKEYRELAQMSLGANRTRYESIANEWERLARYRVELIQYERELGSRNGAASNR